MAIKGGIGGIAEAGLQFFFNADNLTVDKIGGIKEKVTAIFHNFHVESLRVRNFKMDIKWKTRVISVPKAVQNTRDIFDTARELIEDKGKTLVAPFEEFVHTLKLISETDDQSIDPQGGPSKISRAFSAVEDFITQLNILIGAVDKALDEVKSFGEFFDRILKDIETLDDLFLPQSSKRKKETVTYFKRTA